MGEMCILNVGEGDLKLSFDPNNPMEQIQAAKTVTDMLRRGYALFIETGKDENGCPQYARAYDFDENTREYLIAGDGVDNTPPPQVKNDYSPDEEPYVSKHKKGSSTVRVKAEEATGVGVARTAGG